MRLVVLLCAALVAMAMAQPMCQDLNIAIKEMDFLGDRFAFDPVYSSTVAFVGTTTDFTLIFHLYRSDDGGKSWSLQNLPGNVTINDVYAGPHTVVPTSDPDIWYFLGFNGLMWVTTDGGLSYENWTAVAPGGVGVLDVQYSPFLVHPANPEWILAPYIVRPGSPQAPAVASCPDCPASQSLYWLAAVSTNRGRDWTCTGQTLQYAWADLAGHEATFFALVADFLSGIGTCGRYDATRFISDSQAPTFCPTLVLAVSTIPPVPNCIGFASFSAAGQLWVGNFSSAAGCVALYQSTDGGLTLVHPAMPPHGIINSNSWSVLLDEVDATPFISTAAPSSTWGDMFSTVQNGTSPDGYFTFVLGSVTNALSLSLPGMPGVMIANVYTNTQSLTEQSLRTSSKGAVWTPMHVRGDPSRQIQLVPQDKRSQYGLPPYVVGDAIGMIWAVAHEGDTVNRQLMETWFSNDGGATWAFVGQGEWIFEMADKGTLQVAAPWAGSRVPTNDPSNLIAFSVDGGQSPFQRCQYVDNSTSVVEVQNIVTHRVLQTQSFLVLLETASGARAVYLDFSSAREAGPCTASEMAFWQDPSSACLDGVEFGVWRPTTGNCTLVNAAVLPVPSPAACPCASHDFICGWCYRPLYVQATPDGLAHECVPIPNCTQVGSACGSPYDGYRSSHNNQCQLQQGSPTYDVWPASCAPVGVTLPCPQSPTTTLSITMSPTRNPSQSPTLTTGVSRTATVSFGSSPTPSVTPRRGGGGGGGGGGNGISGGVIAGIVLGVLGILCLFCFAAALFAIALGLLWLRRSGKLPVPTGPTGEAYGEMVDAQSERSDHDF